MSHNHKWQILQLFAGEGAGASGASGSEGSAAETAATVDNSAVTEHQRLRELGVPENRIRKPRAKKASPLPEGAYRTTPKTAEKPQAQQAAAAETVTQTEAPPAPARMSWEEIKKDPEYNAEIQKIISARVKDAGKNKAILETLAPALKHLAQEHGLDPENVDHTALVKAITGEYESKALELGVSKETAMKLEQQERTLDEQRKTLEQQKYQEHIQNMHRQAEALRAYVPNFDLAAEMRNPTFARLTSPNVGLSVEDAFYAVHRKEMQAQSMQAAAQQTTKMISDAIVSGSRRPDESGTTAQAPSVSKFDYRNATPAQRKALKDAIRKAAAEGRKIYPG